MTKKSKERTGTLPGRALSSLAGACLLLTALHGTPAAKAANAPEPARATTVRIAQLDIKPEFLEAFTAAVREGMETALRVEPGVFAIYAVADRQNPAKLTFFEMYVDDDAYERHRNTPHFQKYFHTTKHMIARRVLLEAVPVELRDKHVVNSGLAGK